MWPSLLADPTNVAFFKSDQTNLSFQQTDFINEEVRQQSNKCNLPMVVFPNVAFGKLDPRNGTFRKPDPTNVACR